jgi:hypothetical protein
MGVPTTASYVTLFSAGYTGLVTELCHHAIFNNRQADSLSSCRQTSSSAFHTNPRAAERLGSRSLAQPAVASRERAVCDHAKKCMA